MTPAFQAVQKLLTLHEKLELERDTLLLGRQAHSPGPVGLARGVTVAALWRKANSLKVSIAALNAEIADLKRPTSDLENEILAIAQENGVDHGSIAN